MNDDAPLFSCGVSKHTEPPPPRAAMVHHRRLHMFTCYNAAAVVAYLAARHVLRIDVPLCVLHVLRGTSALVALAVAAVYVVYGPGMVVGLYQDLYPGIPPAAALAIDVLYHFVPVLALGLPTDAAGLLAAWGIIAAWYLTVRHKIRDVYMPQFATRDYDLAVFALLPAGAGLMLTCMPAAAT